MLILPQGGAQEGVLGGWRGRDGMVLEVLADARGIDDDMIHAKPSRVADTGELEKLGGTKGPGRYDDFAARDDCRGCAGREICVLDARGDSIATSFTVAAGLLEKYLLDFDTRTHRQVGAPADLWRQVSVGCIAPDTHGRVDSIQDHQPAGGLTGQRVLGPREPKRLDRVRPDLGTPTRVVVSIGYLQGALVAARLCNKGWSLS